MMPTSSKRREISGALIGAIYGFASEASVEDIVGGVADFQAMVGVWLSGAAPTVTPTPVEAEAPAQTNEPARRGRKGSAKTEEKPVDLAEANKLAAAMKEEMTAPAVQETAPTAPAVETPASAPEAPAQTATPPAAVEPPVQAEPPADPECSIYDPANRDHKKKLATILKTKHKFDFDNKDHQLKATDVNQEMKGFEFVSDEELEQGIAEAYDKVMARVASKPPF